MSKTTFTKPFFPAKFAIGIDLGGTKIEGAVVSSDGTVAHSVRLPTPHDYNTTQTVLCDLAQNLCAKQPAVCGIGLSIPGSINKKTGLLRNAPNSPGINGTDFFVSLALKLPLPVRIENDANCLILSEHCFGAARGVDNAVGLIMGTGFGSGVMHAGQLLKGSTDLAPELGHTCVDWNGRLCGCGNRGCVEAYLSGTAILGRYHESGGDASVRDARAVFERQATDTQAKKIIEQTLIIFARVVGNIMACYEPEIIVLGGGVSLQKCYYECEDLIRPFVFGSHEVPPIKPALLGDASGKLGAAALFF